VKAGAILTKEGAILIDTLFYPDETRDIKDFLEKRLDQTVRYVINTHYHADHTQGTYLFPEARVISHTLCREFLDSAGRDGLERMKEQSPELEEVKIVLPDMIFDTGHINIYLGGKTVQISPCPGHSPDIISVLVVNDRIMFASDNMMPVPTIFDGSYGDLVKTLESMQAMSLDSIVQGHGEVILRGEVQDLIESDLAYLSNIKEAVQGIVDQGDPLAMLEKVTIESCGKSRIPLNGFVTDLHQANLRQLYQEMSSV
jgi:glyoxylase-like metal-dependent hydrolase (beta-lactamase superfamily II)